MKGVKFQIPNPKYQINSKFQFQSKSENTMNLLDLAVGEKYLGPSNVRTKSPVPGQNRFGYFYLEIWTLFAICYLVLVIFYIQGLNYF
jgi:hypothetical protein